MLLLVAFLFPPTNPNLNPLSFTACTKLEFVYRSTWHTRGKLVREAFDNISNRYDPQALRDYFLSRYTLPRMAEGYIRVYQSLGV